MSLAGLKKQLNKANQYMSEKIGGAKGTELDEDFLEMERKTDVMGKLAEEVVLRTVEFLQPNPASRAKLIAVNSISKMRGQSKAALYPQPEGVLGETMIKYGKEMGEETAFGSSLVESGESFRQMAEVKYSLEDNVKQNFLEPLDHLQTKDLKEVNHHRKKLSGRRLDFDCKRRKKEKGASVSEDEIMMAEEKFEESKNLAEQAMHNLLDNDLEHIAALQAFIESQKVYHQQAQECMQSLCDKLELKRMEAINRPRSEYVPKPTNKINKIRSNSPSIYDTDSDSGSYHFNNTGPTHYNSSAVNNRQPCCEALYDFEAESEGELAFREADIIQLISQIDENWFEGSVNGQVGYFPINYVKVVVPLH